MEADMHRLRSCLSRFLPHVERGNVALTGGVAIELHLAEAGQRCRRERIADLDFVSSTMGAVAPSVSRDFLVSHYHVARQGVPKGLIQLVDPVTRLRLDVFVEPGATLPGAKQMTVAGEILLVLEPRGILDHKLRTLSREPVDEKHWLDALSLAALCGAPRPFTPAHHVSDVYSTDLNAACDRCDRSRSSMFPLAPKADIWKLLGYV